MKTQLSPAVIIAIVVIALALVGYFGYKKMAPPDSVTGIGPNGQPMTDKEVTDMKNRMKGGAAKPK